MRLMPLITAILVTAALYFLVIERDALLAFAQVAPAEVTEEAEAAPEREAVRVVALRSTAEVVDSALILRGRTEADRQVDVQSETSGLVISNPLSKGDAVSQGDLLCELDPGTRQASLQEALGRLEEARARLPEAEAGVPAAEAALAQAEAQEAASGSTLAQARAQLNEAQINYNAASSLSADGFASETRVANAEAALESARAAVASAEAGVKAAGAQIISAEASVEGAVAAVKSARAGIQSAQAGVASAEQAIAQLSIKAPFDGILDTDTAELGQLLQPGGLCATIIQLDPIKVVGFVPEAEVGKVELGADAGARLSDGQDVVGRVTYISRSSDESTRTFRVEVTVPNPEQRILVGQTAEILIRAEGQPAHLLPASALTLDDDGTLGVRLVTEGDVVSFAPLTLLRDTVEGVWVTGLPDVADVIVVGQEYVIDGVPVLATYRDTETSESAQQEVAQ